MFRTIVSTGAMRTRIMKRNCLILAILLHLNVIHGATIIDSGIRRLNTLNAMLNADADECSVLISSDLVNEIQSYQPIVNQIVSAAIDSKFAGSTWKWLVANFQ